MRNDFDNSPELLDELLANYAKPADLFGEEGLFNRFPPRRAVLPETICVGGSALRLV